MYVTNMSTPNLSFTWRTGQNDFILSIVKQIHLLMGFLIYVEVCQCEIYSLHWNWTHIVVYLLLYFLIRLILRSFHSRMFFQPMAKLVNVKSSTVGIDSFGMEINLIHLLFHTYRILDILLFIAAVFQI